MTAEAIHKLSRKDKLRKELRAFMRAHTWNATYMGGRLHQVDAMVVNFTQFFHHGETAIMKGYEMDWIAGEKAYLKAVEKAFEEVKKQC